MDDDVTSPGPGTDTGGAAEQAAVETDHIVGMSFDKVRRADEALLSVMHLVQEGELSLADAVVVTKDDGGKVRVRQTSDPSPVQGGLSGSLWGMFAGLLFGDPLIGGLVGAAGGALISKLIDVGLDDGWVRQVGDWLDPGTSALLLLVADGLSPTVIRELGRFPGDVLYCTFPDNVRSELERSLGHVADLPVPDSEPPAGA